MIKICSCRLFYFSTARESFLPRPILFIAILERAAANLRSGLQKT